jgi:hypothetical protein
MMRKSTLEAAMRRADRQLEKAVRDVLSRQRQKPVTRKGNISMREAAAAVVRYLRGK